MLLSILVVSYRTPNLTLAAVSSALVVPDVGEVIIVDNDSRDETASLLSGIDDDRVRVIVNGTNRGFGRAANQAANAAKGEVLIFLNSDAELTPQASHELLREVRAHQGRAIAGARLVGSDGVVQRSAGLLPGPLDLTVRALGIHHVARVVGRVPVLGWAAKRNRLADEYESAIRATDPISTTMVTGACCAIGRETFLSLGGFDERFFMYFEDADLCRRATTAGIAIRYVPSAEVPHIGGASSAGDYHFTPMHAKSLRQYLEKWWGPLGVTLALLLLWLRLVGHAIALSPGTGRAFAAVRSAL